MIDPASLPESRRNRLLRRADWRFLLPGPQPGVSVCFAQGPLAEAVSAISTAVVAPAPQPREICDLAVAGRLRRADLQACFAALRPGGSCYVEQRLPVPGGVRAVVRRLEAAGFCDVQCYWPWPAPGRGPAFWWRLDDERVAAYARRRRQVNGPLAWLGRWARENLWNGLRSAGLLFPIAAVARKPPAGASAPADEGVLDRIGRICQPDPPGSTAAPLAWTLITGGRRSVNKVVGLVFAEASPQPSLVVKLPRVGESAAALAQEAATLRELETLGPEGVAGVPRVIYHGQEQQPEMLCETMLESKPLWSILDRESYRSLALQVADWAAGLVQPGAKQPRSAYWSRQVEPVIASFVASYGPALGPGELTAARTRLERLGAMPQAIEQRDLSPWNVGLDPSGKLIVLDWESAQLDGLPARDLIYFLAHLGFFLHGTLDTRRYAEDYRVLLDPGSSGGGVFAEALAHYARRTGLAAADLAPLRLLTWMLHAESEYRRLVEDGGARPAPASLQGAMFLNLWREELRLNHGH